MKKHLRAVPLEQLRALTALMTRKRRLSHDDAEALLSGRPDADPTAIVAALSAGWSGPVEDQQRRHLAAIHEAAARHAHDGGPATAASPLASAAGVSRRRVLLDRSRALAFKLSSSIVALSASTIGLAHAGVDLPGEAAEKAFSVVGIELPNQEPRPETSIADDVGSAKENSEPGCERGRAVATAASQDALGDAKTPSDLCLDDAQTKQSTQGRKDAGQEKATEGKAKADTGKTKADTGKAQAEEKKSEAGPPEGPPADEAERAEDRPERPESGNGGGNGSGGGKGPATEGTDAAGDLTSGPSATNETVTKGSAHNP